MPSIGPPPAWLSNPLIGMGLMLTLLCGFMMGLKAASVRYALHPELLRKLLHVGLGLVTLSFPWLFARPWPVFVPLGSPWP